MKYSVTQGIATAGVLAVLMGLAACGSSPTSPATLSQADITSISNAVAPAVSLALASLGNSLSTFSAKHAGSSALRLRPESTTVPISGTSPCPSSGSTTLNGSFVDSTNANGTGAATINMQIGFSNCVSSGVVLQGNPNMTVTGSFNFTNGNLVNPATFALGGGITFTLNGQTGSATFACTDSINVSTYAFTETGNVTLQYPTGKNTSTTSCLAFGV